MGYSNMKVSDLVPESFPLPVPVTFIHTKSGSTFQLWGNYEYDWIVLSIFRKEHASEEIEAYRLRPRHPLDLERIREMKF